jgi:hypothetical protein
MRGAALLLLASTGGVIYAATSHGPRSLRSRRAVVAFHADQLYVDHSGFAEPYFPPAGLRSLDGQDEEALAQLVYRL